VPARKTHTPASLYWGLALVQIAAMAASTALIWSRLLDGRQSFKESIGQAIFYVLLVRACAFGIALFAFMAVSFDDIGDVLSAAFDASAHAMWLPPAVLLLSTLTPVGMAIGLLLIANTARLLVSRRAPRKHGVLRKTRTDNAPAPLFHDTHEQPGPLPAIIGALALQGGVWAICTDSPLWSALWIAAGTAIWTRSSIARGAYQPRADSRRPYALIAVLLVLLLSASISTAPIAPPPTENPASADIFSNPSRVYQRLAHAADPKKSDPKPVVTRLTRPPQSIGVSAKDAVPGVILRREKPRAQTLTVRPAIVSILALSRPLTIPFTGEYHLFRTSSLHLPPDALVHFGTPLDAVYVTTNGGSIETEAYQMFSPPIDFTHCARVQVSLVSGEPLPASALLRLIAGGRSLDVGPEIFGMNSTPDETIEFYIPAGSRAIRVDAISLLFHHNPVQQAESAKVAIQRFTLIPSGI
jgi:hypothetical protein